MLSISLDMVIPIKEYKRTSNPNIYKSCLEKRLQLKNKKRLMIEKYPILINGLTD